MEPNMDRLDRSSLAVGPRAIAPEMRLSSIWRGSLRPAYLYQTAALPAVTQKLLNPSSYAIGLKVAGTAELSAHSKSIRSQGGCDELQGSHDRQSGLLFADRHRQSGSAH